MAVQADVHLRFHRPESRYEWFHIDRLDFPSASTCESVNLASQKAIRYVARTSKICRANLAMHDMCASTSTIADQVTEGHQHMHYRHAIVSA